ncbi:hypothetical protein M422DRAFT_153760, partial [Sphaerobolus stellatus SS14]
MELLSGILETLYESNLFSRPAKDEKTQCWRAYERVAKEHDEEFLDRRNTDLDSLLIFAGLFSAVSSAFIVDMESDLTPDPVDATNALLMALVHNGYNQTLNRDFTLPPFPGPTTPQIIIQFLAYLSLSTSLLSAFGAVLAKQW